MQTIGIRNAMATSPAVRRDVKPIAVFGWILAGWTDFIHAPLPSLLIGAMCAMFGWILVIALWAFGSLAFIVPLTAGFVLIAPRLAVGLYESSRRQEHGEAVDMACVLEGASRNPVQIWVIGALLMAFLIGWLAVALLVLAAFALFAALGGLGFPEFGEVSSLKAIVTQNWDMVLVTIVSGVVLATSAFVSSAVSLPMLVDRRVSAATAALTSIRACWANPVTSTLWAFTLLALTLLAAVPGFLGFVVMLPVLGHASWHAYRDLVEHS